MPTEPATAVLEAPSPDETPTAMTMRRLRKQFDKWEHKPSPAMWTSLEDLAHRMELIADGNADPNYYLSSLDPGVGKTETLMAFFGSMASFPRYDDVGVLICLSRLDEIAKMARRMGARLRGDFACLTSDSDINALGTAPRHEAKVLFTTHAMLTRRLQNPEVATTVDDASEDARRGGPTKDIAYAPRLFEELEEFFYQGEPRRLRVWDESLTPGLAITVNAWECYRLVSDVGAYPDLRRG